MSNGSYLADEDKHSHERVSIVDRRGPLAARVQVRPWDGRPSPGARGNPPMPGGRRLAANVRDFAGRIEAEPAFVASSHDAAATLRERDTMSGFRFPETRAR